VRFDRAAAPFVVLALIPSVIAWLLGAATVGVVLLLLPIAIGLFFRDPERSTPPSETAVYAPADGKIMHAGPARPGEAPPGDWQQVTIFLSVLDVHINRTPVSGVVRDVRYVPGSFLPAFKRESFQNEHSEIWIDHGGVSVVVRQVVGVLARRVVCRLQKDQRLQAGDRIGLMKFGSRMDVFLPISSKILVTPGIQVTAGETVIGQLAGARS
jgi:phosphatidylserine decarboxylase